MTKVISNWNKHPPPSTLAKPVVPGKLLRHVHQKDWLLICLRIAMLFLVFILVDAFMTKWLRLPGDSYASHYLILPILAETGLTGGLFFMGFFGVLLVTGAATQSWQALDNGNRVRLFVVPLAVLMAWFVSTLGYNYYYDQGYYSDRLLVLVFLALLCWRPVFILPFLVLVFALFWQLATPALNNGSHFAHKLQVLHVLNLFCAWFLLSGFYKKSKSSDFFFLTACLIAAAYWAPAWKKLWIGWLFHGEIFNMSLNAHAHGWLSFVEPGLLVDFTRYLALFDLPMQLFVLSIEAGCLFLFWRRGYAMTLLACLSVFHLGVFVMFGYLFWTWIYLNVAFLLLLFFDRRQNSIKIFTPLHLLLGVVLISTGQIWCSPSQLAWIDARLTYTYRYDAIGASGTAYTIPFSWFEPYGDVFTMANFSYLVDQHEMLVNPYGSTLRKQAESLLSARTLDDVIAMEKDAGWNTYNPEKRAVFTEFLLRFIESSSNAGAGPGLPFAFSPPRQFWSHPRGIVYAGQEPLREVIVKEITTLFDGEKLKEIRDIEVMRVDIRPLKPILTGAGVLENSRFTIESESSDP